MNNNRKNQGRSSGKPRKFKGKSGKKRRNENYQRAQEMEQRGDALSLAEQLADELDYDLESDPESKGEKEIEQVNITKIQGLSDAKLAEAAADEGVENADQLDRKELMFELLKLRLKRSGIMYGHGTLEVLPDGFGFLRSVDHHYLNCPDDIYVSPSQIRKFGMKTGSVIRGQIRPPKERERYFALLRVESIDGMDPQEAQKRINFDELTPLHPDQRIMLEYDSQNMSTRVVDMIAPIGFGQRGLIVSPPRAGKTLLMQNMAKAVLANHPTAYVIMLLVDERPEEVTDVERNIKGESCEVVSSTFDESPSRHVQVADMVLEKAKRMVESGRDVVIFLDSITRLGRAWNQECEQSGKLLTGGLDANALQQPKVFFGSARKVEEGGSLTIIATALIDTGSKMDDVIFEEFKGTGNLEIVLDRSLVERRIWPAIDINRSGTRREERLLDPEEFDRINQMRRVLSEMNPPDAMDLLTSKLKKTQTNAEFLMSLKPNSI